MRAVALPVSGKIDVKRLPEARAVERIRICGRIDVAVAVVSDSALVAASFIPHAGRKDEQVVPSGVASARGRGAARSAKKRRVGQRKRNGRKRIHSGTRHGNGAGPGVAVELEPDVSSIASLRQFRSVKLLGARRGPARAKRPVNGKRRGFERAARRHGNAVVGRDVHCLRIFKFQAGRIRDEVKRGARADERARGAQPDRQAFDVAAAEGDPNAVAKRRSRKRAARAGGVEPLDEAAEDLPPRRIGRRGGKEKLLPRRCAVDADRPLKDEICRIARNAGRECVPEFPRGQFAGERDFIQRSRSHGTNSRGDLSGEREAGAVARLRVVDEIRRAEPVRFVGVGDGVAVEVVERRRGERVRVRSVHEAVAVGVADARIGAESDLGGVGNAVEVGVRHVRIGAVEKNLGGGRKPVAVAVGIFEVGGRDGNERKGRDGGGERVRGPWLAAQRRADGQAGDGVVRGLEARAPRRGARGKAGKVVAVVEAAVGEEFELDGDGRIRHAAEQRVLPSEKKCVGRRHGAPELARTGRLRQQRPVRGGDDPHGRVERRKAPVRRDCAVDERIDAAKRKRAEARDDVRADVCGPVWGRDDGPVRRRAETTPVIEDGRVRRRRKVVDFVRAHTRKNESASGVLRGDRDAGKGGGCGVFRAQSGV